MVRYDFDKKLADSIVRRTMEITGCNVNVMDENGYIIGSGDAGRTGQIHEGALLVLAQKRVVEIDKAAMQTLQGCRPGINLPLRLNNDIVGVIGLTGEPDKLRQSGELVRMAAEMMLEQAQLLQILARNSRLKEELVLSLLRSPASTSDIHEFARRLGVDLEHPRVALVAELDSGQLGISTAMAELQQLQALLTGADQDELTAIVSLTEMVILKPACFRNDCWEPEIQLKQMAQLYEHVQQKSYLKMRLALGNYFPGEDGISRSCFTARAVMKVGKQRSPDIRCHSYHELKLPVLLESLTGGWQATELQAPLRRLKMMDSNGVLRKTLHAWFQNNQQMAVTAKSLYIHKNTLEYRLHRISDLTSLDLWNVDERFLLYVAVQLDED